MEPVILLLIVVATIFIGVGIFKPHPMSSYIGYVALVLACLIGLYRVLAS